MTRETGSSVGSNSSVESKLPHKVQEWNPVPLQPLRFDGVRFPGVTFMAQRQKIIFLVGLVLMLKRTPWTHMIDGILWTRFPSAPTAPAGVVISFSDNGD